LLNSVLSERSLDFQERWVVEENGRLSAWNWTVGTSNDVVWRSAQEGFFKRTVFALFIDKIIRLLDDKLIQLFIKNAFGLLIKLFFIVGFAASFFHFHAKFLFVSAICSGGARAQLNFKKELFFVRAGR
jgi:hypothetical protein